MAKKKTCPITRHLSSVHSGYDQWADANPLIRIRSVGAEIVGWEEAVKAFVTWLIKSLATKLPFLGWPLVGWIISYFLTPVLIEFIKKLLLWFNFNLIDRVVDNQRDKYDQFTEELKKIHDDPNATDKQAEEAIDKFHDSFSDLIHLTV